MIRSVWKYLFLVGIISFLTYSCVKKKTYPTIPEIEYKDFILYSGDSASLVIKFTDGDGDIGVSATDSTQNLFYTYYFYDSTSTVKGFRAVYSNQLNDTLRTGYIVRSPTNSYKGKPISGELSIRLQEYRHSTTAKRIKFVVTLYDNARNKSVPIATPEIDVP